MNAPTEITREALTPYTPGIPLAGGFYAGRILIGGIDYALIIAPKAERTLARARWSPDYDSVPGAMSFSDGYANTRAMAEAGSKLAKAALAKEINGLADWYIPALDEMEILYRNLKPGTEANYCYMRSGINQSAVPPTAPYTPESPAQTDVEAFRVDGPEAIEERAYWSSTQSAGSSRSAWGQNFLSGYQSYWFKDYELPALLVRREAIR